MFVHINVTWINYRWLIACNCLLFPHLNFLFTMASQHNMTKNPAKRKYIVWQTFEILLVEHNVCQFGHYTSKFLANIFLLVTSKKMFLKSVKNSDKQNDCRGGQHACTFSQGLKTYDREWAFSALSLLLCLKLQLHDAIYGLRFYWNSLIHLWSLSNLHNNIASIQKNRGDKSHRVIITLTSLAILSLR